MIASDKLTLTNKYHADINRGAILRAHTSRAYNHRTRVRCIWSGSTLLCVVMPNQASFNII